jgi:hypothetical protein
MTSGIPRIDEVYAGATAVPITDKDNTETIGAVQDLIRGQGKQGIPSFRDRSYGQFKGSTVKALLMLQQSWKMKVDPKHPSVDHATLVALVERPHRNPIVSRVYLTLAMNVPWDERARILSYVSYFEGRSRFTANETNLDKHGFAFGLIQWTQEPGRLAQIMTAFDAQRPRCVKIFGGEQAWAGALAQVRKPHGGVDEHDGTTPAADKAYDFGVEPWPSRFKAAARDPVLMKIQLQTALSDLDQYIDGVKRYWTEIASIRARGYMIDLVNQHGDGGARSIFNKVHAGDEPDEAKRLAKLTAESLRRIAAQYGLGSDTYRAAVDRRTWFATSPILDP